MRIIPAIDIINGKCVRLTKGNYLTKKIYNENPLEVAKMFEDSGVRYLHLVDLDGAKSQHIVNQKVLEKLAIYTNLKIDFGGGIKSMQDVETAFQAGAHQITIGSLAVHQSELAIEILEKFGSDKIILGADSKNNKIVTQGWLYESKNNLFEFLQFYQQQGIKSVIATDIEKDGMLVGPAFDLYREIISKTILQPIASGGITSMEDLLKLKEIGCEGAIIGKALYEGKINLKKLIEQC